MSKTNQEQKEKWYWVKIDGEWSPAMYDPRSSGGWTNADTWEDFDGDVVAWQEIVPPNTACSRLWLLIRKIQAVFGLRQAA